ncbi:MAG TPA: RDD family protein [Baekduia sp.]
MEDYQDRLPIATPEGVTLDLVLAGVGSRFAASLIDLTFKLLLIGAALFVCGLIGDLGLALSAILTFGIYFGYDVAFEVLANGRTPGKRWTGLRVLREDGRPVDLLSSAIRNVVRLIDGLPFAYLPAMASILATRKNQRIGDLAGRTIVVREPRGKEVADAGFAVELPPRNGTRPSFGGFQMPVGNPAAHASSTNGALDVSAISADDLAAVRAFLDRRRDLPAGVRGDIARRIASALAPRVGGATANLHDEDLIEAVAAAKARER